MAQTLVYVLTPELGGFIKSYLNILPWSDSLVYMQAQGYWILNNWLLTDIVGQAQYADLALTCSEAVLSTQQLAGYWEYPNPEWKGRVATVEGSFAALGLMESYARVGHLPYLEGAKNWYQYLLERIGFS